MASLLWLLGDGVIVLFFALHDNGKVFGHAHGGIAAVFHPTLFDAYPVRAIRFQKPCTLSGNLNNDVSVVKGYVLVFQFDFGFRIFVYEVKAFLSR
jgi:hypothetical protein